MAPCMPGRSADPPAITPNLVSSAIFPSFQSPNSAVLPQTPERQRVCTPIHTPLSGISTTLHSENSPSSYYSLSPSSCSASAANSVASPNGSERSLLPSISFYNDVEDHHLGYEQLALRTVLSRHNGARAHEDVGHLGFSDEDYEDDLINEVNMYDSDCSDFAIDVDRLSIDELSPCMTFKSPQAVLTVFGAGNRYESPKRLSSVLEPINEQPDMDVL